MKKKLYEIKEAANKLINNTEEEIRLKIEIIKKRKEKENISNLIIDWFALVQEVSFRTIGLRHFETQLLAGLILTDGKIVEMKTGEGKTLVSTLPASLFALEKKGVHVVTVNEYLAERDQKWMGKVYNGLGLTVGLVKSNNSKKEKQKSYQSDITYLTNSELVFDYLRDNTARNIEELVQRPFYFCLIDEIDSILIDEARTPLILSEQDNRQQNVDLFKLSLAKNILPFLQKDIHFEVDEKKKDIFLTDRGYEETQKQLGVQSLFENRNPWILEILNALKAKYLFKKEKDYMIINNKIVIVDELTGRFMEDRRWSMGIHEAVEIKESLEVKAKTKTKSSITYQNFFTLYPKLAGMTGTAKTEEKEFRNFYNLEVVVLPTSKPMIRKDLEDLVYQNQLSKWRAVINQAQNCFNKKQPVLIGTTTVEKSEFLSALFKSSNIPHQILNAKPENVKRESEIIAQAGEIGAVTIATNMAGRGTDIILGGNPSFKIKQKISEIIFAKIDNTNNKFKNEKETILEEYKKNIKKLKFDIENLPYSLENCEVSLQDLYRTISSEVYEKWENQNKFVKELGGLFVLGTERHETRRIDNQLRGRAGRQGDPGYSQFFVSLDDDLIRSFGGDSIRKWVKVFMEDEDLPLESSLLTKSLENAQKKVESYYYEIRKNLFDYDEILNSHRKLIFEARQEILRNHFFENFFLLYNETDFNFFLEKEKKEKITKIDIEQIFGYYSTVGLKYQKNSNKNYKDIWITTDFIFSNYNFYQPKFLTTTRAEKIVEQLDLSWKNHIERMSYIKETIQWRAYGQQNPLLEYNYQALESFKIMLKEIRSSMIYYFLNESNYPAFFAN